MKFLFMLLALLYVPYSFASTDDNCRVGLENDTAVFVSHIDLNIELRYKTKNTTLIHNLSETIWGINPSCQSLQYFPKNQILLLELYMGSAGTSQITKGTELFIFSLAEQKLQLIKNLEIEESSYGSRGDIMHISFGYQYDEVSNSILMTNNLNKAKHTINLSTD